MQFLKLTHNSWSDDLLKVLSTMRSLNEMCDLKLILQSETVVAHSCVLAAASPFFKTILSGTENPEINLESFPSRIVMYMLDFIYNGTVFFPRDDLDILHSVASTLNIPSLLDLTQEMKMHCLPEDLKENDYDSISSHPTLELEHNKEVLMQQPQENDRLTSRERLSDSLQTVSDNSNLSLTMNLANMVGTLEPLDEIVDNNEQIQNADSPTAIQIYVKDEDTTESDVQEMICFREDSAEPHITENDPNKEEFHTLEDGQASYTSVLKKEIFDPQITRRQHKRAVPSALITIEDKPVPADGSISDRAIQTLPDGLFLDVSSINKTVNGIFTRQLFPKGALFGPYEGEILQEITLSNNFLMQYCWKIYRDGKLVHWLSGQNESLANWMRYVQHANNPQQQNLEAFQHHGQLFFRAIKDIQQYSELAVKYGNNQSSVLGTANNHENLLDVSCAQYGETDVFRCENCDILYTSEVIYYKHMHIKHSQSLPLHVYVQTDKERNTCLAAEQNKEQNIDRPVTGSKMASGITRTRYSSRCQRKNEQGNIRKTERLTLHCEVCKKVFTSLGNLQKHKLIHSNERPYVCPTCGRAFVQKSNMKAHMKIHNDEKHHVCSNCGKRFCRRTELRRHEKFHSTETPYLCSVCNRGFKSIGNLKRHQICHTGEKPYKCSICHKDFNRVENLKTHMRRHTGEKPFQCTLCGNCFTENAHLRIHMRRHSGEKPYVCSVCSKSFVDATTLRVHSKVHHKEQCLIVQAS